MVYQNYPTIKIMAIIENLNWALSAEKRNIPLFQSEENLQSPILFIGGVHGDEPEGVALAEELLEWLKNDSVAANGNTKKAKISWALIPCLNPDGYLRGVRWNGNKVDLNRNYPSSDWSTEAKAERYYPGPGPGSESEISNLVAWITKNKPRLIIHFHSWQPCVVYAGAPALPAAQLLGQASGYKVQDDIGYPTPGSLSQYAWFDHKIPVICTEELSPTPRAQVWPRFSKGLIQILTEPHTVGLA
jgi:protein MpaA